MAENDQPIDTDATPVISDAAGGQKEGLSLPFPIVGIGASAGGLEAYIELFRNLPSDTGMAFVVISHLPPDQRSHLPEIIARHTQMRTSTIQSGIRPEPDSIYFLPSNARAALKSGVFELETRIADGPFRPIDFFFNALAGEQKNLAVGIVLSGMDSDGALGLKAIKGEAGIAIVQAPESARFPEMPRSSISADHVDMVLPPDQIAHQLAELAKRYRNPDLYQLEEGQPTRDDELFFGRILRHLKGVSGVDFQLYKPTTIRRRVARRMLMHRIDRLADYAELLQLDPMEARDLQEDILIGVTRFFRDPEVFEALKQQVFPEIFGDRPPEQQVRMWVAGCSSGEEVYSLAICLLEYFAGKPIEPSIQIFGTDASEQNIQRARAGIYSETIAAEVSPERLRRFFLKTEKGYQVAKRIRDLCIFARQNLCNDPPFSRLDLVSCRNVLIYFGSHLQRQLIPTFHYALRPNGFLLLGASETIRDFADFFTLTDRKHKIYSKVGATSPRALVDIAPHVYISDLAIDMPTLRANENLSDLEIQRTADRIVLARYGPPGVVVDERMEIIQSRGHTSPFLEMAQGSASLQLPRMLRESIASQVVPAVKRAIEQDLPVQVERLQVQEREQTLEATLEVLPMHTTGSRSKCYLVLFVPRQVRLHISKPQIDILAAEIEGADKEQAIAQLQSDLSSSRLYLQTLLEERDAKNQELVSANEEIQSANEELQSTNEELETTKEELQSSNEELQTVNDELQNRNTVLTQTTNDLSNLLNSVNLPVLMLSEDLSIRHFTPQAQRLMNVRTSDIGRPFGDIRLNLNIEDLKPLFTEVLDTLGARELEVQDRDGHWYLLRVRPYRTADNKIEGLVVVLVDIDQLRRSQQELREARDFATSVIESIPLPLVVVNSDFRIHTFNEAFAALASSNSNALAERFLPDLAASLWKMEPPLRSLLEGLRNEKAGGSFEFEYKAADQSAKIFLVRGRPLHPDGRQFLLVTFEDITAHREVERLLNAERERLASQVESTTKELDRSRGELQALTGSLLTSQEEERRRVARELHDDLSQRLAAIGMQGDAISQTMAQDPAAARSELERILKALGDLAEDVRLLSHRLHPAMLDDLGLAAALRSLTEEFGEREAMITTFYSDQVPETIPREVATGLYRIAQEALRNVAKHAGQTHIKVQLKGVPGGLELQVADAGKGFDMEQIRPGLGLISMRERAHLIGATIQVQSAVHEGTKVSVYVPLQPAV